MMIPYECEQVEQVNSFLKKYYYLINFSSQANFIFVCCKSMGRSDMLKNASFQLPYKQRMMVKC